MSFDRLAPHYCWIEAVFAGARLQRCRVALLDALSPPQNALIYGEGNGRFLAELLRRFPNAQVTVVEMSAVMIRLARERLNCAGLNLEHVVFIETDALTWTPPAATFDLIVTCFFLDCFREDQLQQLIPAIARAARPDAQWLLADFQIAHSGLRRWCSRVIVGLLYAFFRWATRLPGRRLVDPAPHLQSAGLTCVRCQEYNFGMLYSSRWTR